MSAVRVVVLTSVADTYRFADRAFRDSEGHVYDARVRGEIEFARESSCYLWSNSRGDTSTSAITLANSDGALDALVMRSQAGMRVSVYWLPDGVTDVDASTIIARDDVERIIANAESEVRIVRRSILDRLAVRTFAQGRHGGTRPEALRDTPLPAALGRPLSCPMPLIDPVDVVFQPHDSGAFEVPVVRDGGVVLTLTTDYTVSTIPAEVELTDSPERQVVADIRAGAATVGATHDVYSAVSEILGRAGIETGDWNTSAFIAIRDLYDASGVSYWCGEGQSCRELLDAVADSLLLMTFTDADGRISAAPVLPPADVPVSATLSLRNLRGQLQVDRDAAPNLPAVVLAGRNWFVYQAGDLLDAVSDADKQMLSAEYRFRAPVGPVSAETVRRDRVGGSSTSDVSLVDSRRDARRSAGMPTLLDDTAAAAQIAERIEQLYRPDIVPRWVVASMLVDSSDRDALRLVPGDCVQLDFSRFGLSIRALVTAVRGRVGSSELRLKLWCPVPVELVSTFDSIDWTMDSTDVLMDEDR
jgi:hypothetical protein